MFHVKHESPPALLFLDEALEGLRSRDLLRDRQKANEAGAVSFCSNDYLGLASRCAGNGAVGAGASRLVAGERPEHQKLEMAAAALVKLPAALAFTSGYAANVGMLSALAQSGDLIVSDALNHASLIDGARLSRARVEIVPHIDPEAVERALKAPRSGRAFVVTESYFSMDADAPDLPALRRVCDAHGAALIVDEAHALGVLGPEGRGLCAASAVVPDVLTGTFGKAFGAAGAFAAGCPSLVKWLWNRARSFVFSTGLSPVVASAAEVAIRLSQEHPELRERTLRASVLFRRRLGELGIQPAGFGHVIPWIIGDAAAAVRVAKRLREQGIDAQAIRPPSVPDNTARIRLTVTAAHTDADIESAATAINHVLEQESIRATRQDYYP
jgi:8-amino-7-oxononanoate synthase